MIETFVGSTNIVKYIDNKTLKTLIYTQLVDSSVGEGSDDLLN